MNSPQNGNRYLGLSQNNVKNRFNTLSYSYVYHTCAGGQKWHNLQMQAKRSYDRKPMTGDDGCRACATRYSVVIAMTPTTRRLRLEGLPIGQKNPLQQQAGRPGNVQRGAELFPIDPWRHTTGTTIDTALRMLFRAETGDKSVAPQLVVSGQLRTYRDQSHPWIAAGPP